MNNSIRRGYLHIKQDNRPIPANLSAYLIIFTFYMRYIHVMSRRAYIFIFFARENIQTHKMDFGVTMFPSFRSGHVNNFTRSILKVRQQQYYPCERNELKILFEGCNSKTAQVRFLGSVSRPRHLCNGMGGK